MLIGNKGNPTSPVWVLIDRPLSGDVDRGYLYSAPTGFIFDKMMHEAGIEDYFVTCYRPDWESEISWRNVAADINHYKPPFIIPLGAIGKKLLPQMSPKNRKKNYNEYKDSEIQKYAGSILSSRDINYPHYIVPTLSPEDVIKQWKLRDIVISCDLGKIAAELDWWNKNGKKLQPLPVIQDKIDFECFDELLSIIDSFLSSEYISNDIETIYPKAPTKTLKSQFYKILPGYPIAIGLTNRIDFGISFNLFRDSTIETRELWKHLSKLLWEVPSVGQNFFNFDACFYESLGMRLDLKRCRDTMILHHILWPELPHKLQFLARQYTRHAYWKDEAAGWSLKNMNAMKRYNVKDICTTLEIFYAEISELKERGLE